MWATKTETETERLLDVARREGVRRLIPLAISLANVCEEWRQVYTLGHFGNTDQTFCRDLQQLLHCGIFRDFATRFIGDAAALPLARVSVFDANARGADTLGLYVASWRAETTAFIGMRAGIAHNTDRVTTVWRSVRRAQEKVNRW